MAGPVSTDVVNRVHAIMDELRSLRKEMSQPGVDAFTGLATHKLPLDEGRQLKNVVDDFRMFLWAYLDTWDTRGDNPKARLQKIRMQSAADLLSFLAEDFRSSSLPVSGEREALRKSIDAVVPLFNR